MSKFEGVWTEEEDLTEAAALAFHSLAERAERLATWKEGQEVGDLVSGSIVRLAERATAFAARNPVPPLQPNPLARLAVEVAHLRELESASVEERKERATWLAAKCREESSLSAMRLDWLLERRQSEAKAAARESTLRAKLGKVKGDKKAFRKWKRKAREDREKARFLDLYGRIYRAGMTVEEAAEKMGISKRTAEGLLAKARKEGFPGFTALPRGRRKNVEVAGNVGIEEAERIDARRGW